ncbi:MAG TPA: carboxypeptidase-like regulatory domain-containing protein [Bryobacteraceae bacterium]|nr:carboxypeptidase-like regulatory domain-containing protein [Bryobacteraceae bacterium]
MKTSLLVLLLAVPAVVVAQPAGGPALPPSGNVAVPLEEYNKLVELAEKPAKPPEAPPVPFTLNRAELKLRVAGESVSGTIQFEGEVLAKGAVKVPLIAGMTVVDAQAQGRPLPIEQIDGTHTAVLSGPGEFTVTLEAGVQLSIEPGRASFKLPVPLAGAVRLELVVPGDNTNVGIFPGLVTSRASSGGQTTVEATLVPGQASTIGWTTRENIAPVVPKEVRFLSDVKTLASVSDGQLAIAALVDITVVQGEPAQFELAIPAGYEVTDSTGPSLEASETQGGVLILKITRTAQRSHQFLVSMERSIDAPKAEVPILSFKGAQRETGEILVDSEGTMELTAKESGGLKRMDLKEVNPSLRSLARHSLQAAFRFHRQPTEAAGLALEWVRFPDSNVLAAVAQRAVVTTLVTSEGRSLTEVRLVVSNQAQPFLKIALPAGASILSADVAGEKVKPVEGADGSRVPLLRAGFRPSGPYTVSFVFMHSGAPFAKKGGSELSLPKMDVPIGLVQWEVFLPQQYKVKDFGGDAMSTSLLPPVDQGAAWAVVRSPSADLRGGQLASAVYDPSGAVIPNAKVVLTNEASKYTRDTVTNAGGVFDFREILRGTYTVAVTAPGFTSWEGRGIAITQGAIATLPNIMLNVRGARQEVTVVSASEMIVPVEAETSNTLNSQMVSNISIAGRDAAELVKIMPGMGVSANGTSPYGPSSLGQNAPSSNVGNLQRRVAGVLPIAVDVPHEGNSYRFVRPLVLDEETKVTFSYKTR